MDLETKFKSELTEKLKNKNLSESSIKLYLRNLEKLNDNKPMRSLNFLNNIDNIKDKIKEFKPNTQRNYIISICSALNVLKPRPKIYEKYFTDLKDMNTKLKKEESENIMSENQKKNWIEWPEILQKRTELETKVNEFKNKKSLTTPQYRILLSYLVLSLYTYIQPRRNKDFQNMTAFKNLPLPDENTNYLNVKDKQFIFRDYKTAKTEKKNTGKDLIIDIPNDLMNVIDIYLKFHPSIENKKKYMVPFLVNEKGEKFKNINSMTLLLNSIFKKQISSSMIRHSFITYRYKDIQEQMKQDAINMSHSTAQQKDYVKK